MENDLQIIQLFNELDTPYGALRFFLCVLAFDWILPYHWRKNSTYYFWSEIIPILLKTDVLNLNKYGFEMKKITLKFYPNNRKRNTITGKRPIYMFITSDGVKAEKRLDWDLIESEFQAWNKIQQRVDIAASYTNTFLDAIQLKFTHLKLSDFKDIQLMSAYEIRDYVLGIKSHSKMNMTIFGYANNHYYQNIEKNTKYRKNTKINYRKAINHLRAFVESRQLEHTRVSSLDYDFAQQFTSYLMSDGPSRSRLGMSEVSACGILKKFRTIFDHAIEQELILKNPFKQIKLSYKSAQKPNLTLSQFNQLIHCDTITERERVILNVFLLMSFTGCAFGDCSSLRRQNIEKIEKNVFRLKYNRIKTGIESQQFLSSQALSLLKAFEQQPDVQTSAYLVPRISSQHLNRTLKIIALKLNIFINLSSHVGRHSFRMLIDEADIIDPTVVNKMMGWSNKAGMDAIYRRVSDTRLLKTKTQFEHYLNNEFYGID